MKIKHKVIKEFQYLLPDKKIFVLKAGTILEEYNYTLKSDTILVDREIVDNNPEFFEVVDWKTELLSYMRVNKMPQPAQLGKKIIPFIEEMVISSMCKESTMVVGDTNKELMQKESELSSREMIIKGREEEVEIRIKRVEKRESEYKEDLKNIDKRESNLREKSVEISNRSLDLEDRIQDLNEKERNMDRVALNSSKEIDDRYSDLQKKIDEDMEILSEKERKFESKLKEISERESMLASKDMIGNIIASIEDLEDAAVSVESVAKKIGEFRQFYQGASREAIESILQSIYSDAIESGNLIREKMSDVFMSLREK